MGLLDKVKETAAKAAEGAKKGTASVKDKIGDAQLQKKADDNAKQIGWLIVKEKTEGVALVIPRVADYTEVWRTISALAVWKLLVLVAVMGGNLVTYWPQQTTAMPGITLAQAAVNSQTSNSIANVVPGGQAVAVAFAYYI